MVVVWGGIAYQILGGFSGEEEPLDLPEYDESITEAVKDTFHYELDLSYEDPFKVAHRKRNITNATHSSASFIGKTNRSRQQNKRTPAKVVQWPIVEYGGLVKSSNQKKVALLTINGSSYLAKEGETLKGVDIKKYTEEEILIKFNGEEKSIKK